MVKTNKIVCTEQPPKDICVINNKTQKERQMKNIFKNLQQQLANLFRPEEVEVTFKVVGKRVTYTYTKAH